MANFKTDESFLEKISIGAIGTKKVFENLKLHGHAPIELERGSMNYKIWEKIKIKRIRVPDILCVSCGIRIESRAKRNLEITMSHSFSDPERGWDFGMKDNDYVALVVCKKFGENPIDWKANDLIQYVLIKDLRKVEGQGQVDYIKPKGAEEGFEARITWPAAIAKYDGEIKGITPERIQYTRKEDGRTISMRLCKKELFKKPLVKIGDTVYKNQIIASVVPVLQTISSPNVSEDYFLKKLNITDLSERYAAAKALSFFNSEDSQEALLKKLMDTNEHIYVKLEVAASLARFDIEAGYDFIKTCLKDNYVQNVLETVIVLAEIKTNKSCNMLCEVLKDENKAPEIRAGAAWGLGELNNRMSLESLVSSFNTVEENIKVEATRALAKLTNDFSVEILNKFKQSNPIERPGIAWALTKSDSLTLENLIDSLSNEDSRHWISYIIGKHGEERYISEIEKLKNKRVVAQIN